MTVKVLNHRFKLFSLLHSFFLLMQRKMFVLFILVYFHHMSYIMCNILISNFMVYKIVPNNFRRKKRYFFKTMSNLSHFYNLTCTYKFLRACFRHSTPFFKNSLTDIDINCEAPRSPLYLFAQRWLRFIKIYTERLLVRNSRRKLWTGICSLWRIDLKIPFPCVLTLSPNKQNFFSWKFCETLDIQKY